MAEQKVERYFFTAFFLGVIVLAGAILFPYLGALVLAGVLAVLIHPLHVRVLQNIPQRTIATLATVGMCVLIFVLPALAVGYLVVVEVQDMSAMLANGGFSSINAVLAPLNGHLNALVPVNLQLDVLSIARETVAWFSSRIGDIFTSTASLILRLFVTLIALFYFLRDGHKFRRVLVRFSPLADDADEEILNRLDRVVHSLIRGTFLIAMVQGALTGIGLWAAGVPNPALWGVIATIGAVIPNIGTIVAFGPAALYLLVSGEFALMLLLGVWGFLVVGLVDNIFRPQLIGKNVAIHPLLIFLSVLGGLALFGASGFLIGPLVLGILVALADIYANKMHIERSVLHEEETVSFESH